MTNKLYTRIALNFLMLIGIGMIAVVLWFYVTVGRTVARDVHAMLQGQTDFIAALVQSRLDGGQAADECAPLLAIISKELGVQTALLNEDGEPLVLSNGLADGSLLPVSDWMADVREKGRFVQSGHFGRAILYVRPVNNDGAAPVYLYAGRVLSGDRHHLAFMGGLLVIGCLLVAAVYPLSRSITRPLSRLTGSLEKIAAGDFEQAPPSRRKDEIGRLFAVFRKMSLSVDEMMRSGRQLLADMSHELRSPLARIRLGTELLHGASTGDKAARFLQVIETEVEALDRLVVRMAAYSRMHLPGFALSAGPVSPAALARHACALYHPMAGARQVTLALAVDGQTPDVQGDFDLLSQVFCNLLDNAFDHTPDGGRITVGARQEGEQICFFVTDTGPGVSAEHRERIFEPLYRVDPARNSESGRAGLGLAIARKIMALHQGEIQYRGNGSDSGFYFWLHKRNRS
ncbi:sensor histidine kinase [Desulfatitalea alkaliphila]|uniref:histidine kinase n=1 Tax=Desulfatitalea alkaliphila TaxID=2929485 RepID=A0AA41UKD9_9BACT|nr:HAMP domain-containing sensor histidine kinase [Desulfatitalea alkaliphila]MCJ8502214.1 HAMP domain-containing histidine kinase [Desulfatitalea alkaliphila]